MDVIIRHNHTPGSVRPWSWEAAPDALPTPPSVPRRASGFLDCASSQSDAEREGHRVREVRE